MESPRYYLCNCNKYSTQMKLIEFMEKYPTEASCKDEWRKIRERKGLVCPVCGGIVHYWKSDKECFECAGCHYRQSLKANTVMHGSRLPIRYWFIAMHLLTSTKKGISACELQRQLGHRRYVPIWAMLHKLRSIMGQRDNEYKIDGAVELDDGFFTTGIPQEEKDAPLKRGRGSQRKTKVLVMASTAPGNGEFLTKRSVKPTALRYVKMVVVSDLKSKTIDGNATTYIDNDSIINTDKSTSYTNFKDIFKVHNGQVIPHRMVGKMLPWVHISISNAKRELLDIHHNSKLEYLQFYLNEYCYKVNRRYFNDKVFDRLLLAGVTYKNSFRYNIGQSFSLIICLCRKKQLNLRQKYIEYG